MSILQLSRKKVILVMTACIFLYQIFFPITALAIGGPSQPEFSNFEPTSNTEMVNTLNGDFQYSLNVMDIEGYEVKLNYSSSGMSMDRDASWVGLGWNLNPGTVTRQMRGLPDDFKGDIISEVNHVKEQKTYGVNLSLDPEFLGFPVNQLGLRLNIINLGISSNNYNGISISYNPSVSLSKSLVENKYASNSISLGIDLNSSSGSGLSFSYGQTIDDKETGIASSNSVGLSMNSRTGVVEASMNLNNISESTLRNMYGTPQLTPTAPYSTTNLSINIHGHISGEVWTFAPGMGIGASINTIKLSQTSRDVSSYGYYYYEEADPDQHYLDYVKDMEGKIEKDTRIIPQSFSSPDIFSFSGQGLNGSFSLERNDIMIVGQKRVEMNRADNLQRGVDIGAGNAFKGGASISIGHNKATQGTWIQGNEAYRVISEYNSNIRKQDDYKYFKESSSAKFSNNEKFEVLNRYNTLTSEFSKTTGGLKNSPQMKITSSNFLATDHTAPSTRHTKESINAQPISRDKNGNIIITYTNEELVEIGGGHQYVNNTTGPENLLFFHKRRVVSPIKIKRSDSVYKPHHIGKITIISKNGTRYNYDIPVYNNYTESRSMRVSANSFRSDGLCTITSTENSTNNSSGKDNHFHKKTIPAYAHSYLLTSIVSPDYVDLTSDGMTSDDFGNAYFFYYEKSASEYKWRLPHSSTKAIFNPGLHSLNYDNSGLVESGSKEIWNLKAIMTKNRLAHFITSETVRQDGIGTNNRKVKSLDRIELFDRHNLYEKCRQTSLSSCTNVVPIKTVHFDYDYSLCSNMPNSLNNVGKLTLKKVYFTFGNSEKGSLSPYEFDYSSVNPDYKYSAKDPWGTYRGSNYEGRNFYHWPYSHPDKGVMDSDASAWLLEKITLPSKGSIEIDYESDDYAYVQDKKSMLMTNILGFTSELSHEVMSERLYAKKKMNNYLYFSIDPTLVNGSHSRFRQLYLDGIKDVYFRTRIQVSGTNNNSYEYVQGFFQIKSSGIKPGTNDIGYIELSQEIKFEPYDKIDLGANPIAFQAWQLGKESLPGKMYKGSDPKGEDENAFVGMLSSIKELINLFSSDKGKMMSAGHGRKVDLKKSFVRLLDPTRKKIGGGARVKKIITNDNWDQIGGGENRGTGYSYTYTKIDPETNMEISSGVATNEPSAGREQNPLIHPNYYPIFEKGFLGIGEKKYPSALKFNMGPVGFGQYPGPSVSYSKVTVESISVDETQDPLGRTEYEYYTCADFPVKSFLEQDMPELFEKKLDLILYYRSISRLAKSQGMVIIMNDMHGKMKSIKKYNNDNQLIESQEYVYDFDEYKLTNEVLCADNEGNLTYQNFGVSSEVTFDFREGQNESFNGAKTLNVDLSIYGFIPIPIPTIWPDVKQNFMEVKTASSSKVIRKRGILKEIKYTKYDFEYEMHNLIWDKESGEVILTLTTNKFKDPVYDLKIPAYWKYDGMGSAAHNVKVNKTISFTVDDFQPYGEKYTLTKGIVNDAHDYFTYGDKVLVFDHRLEDIVSGEYDHSFIGHVAEVGNNYIRVQYEDGRNLPAGLYTLTVLDPGRTHNLTTEVSSITTLEKPFEVGPSTDNKIVVPTNDVLNASAIEYDDTWKTWCYKTSRESCGLNDTAYAFFRFINEGLKNNQFEEGLAQQITSPILTDFTSLIGKSIPNLPLPSGPYYLKPTLHNYNDTVEVLYINDVDEVPDSVEYCGGPECIWEDQYYAIDTAIINRTTQSGENDTGIMEYDTIKKEYHYTIKIPNPFPDPPSWTFKIGTDTINGNIDDPNGICDFKINMSSVPATRPDLEDFDSIKFLEYGSYEFPLLISQIYLNGNAYDITISPLDPECKYGFIACDTVCFYNAQEDTADVSKWRYGLRGNWRPIAKYHYLGNRSQSSNLNLKKDGVYESFNSFFKLEDHSWTIDESSSDYWSASEEITIFDPNGNVLEAKDAIGNYNSALYSVDHTVQKAVAQNAKYRQIANENFEEALDLVNVCEDASHFDFVSAGCTGTAVIDSIYHTGKKAFYIPSNSTCTQDRPITGCQLEYFQLADWTLNCFDCIGMFAPDKEKSYLLSAWVYINDPNAFMYEGPKIEVEYDGSVETFSFIPSGPIIDGWQKIEGEFYIPDQASTIYLSLVTGSDYAIFDDFRVHPIDANMKSFIVDKYQKKLRAELDENNFATIYEYDEEGRLMRVKRETETGVMTVKENRMSLVKRP